MCLEEEECFVRLQGVGWRGPDKQVGAGLGTQGFHVQTEILLEVLCIWDEEALRGFRTHSASNQNQDNPGPPLHRALTSIACQRSKLYQSHSRKFCPDPMGFLPRRETQEVGSSKSRNERSTQKCAGHSWCVTKAMSPTYLYAKRVVLLDQHPALLENLLHGNGSMIT